MRKSNGPRTDPCGTPQVILLMLDDTPLTNTYCLLLDKYDSNHLYAVFRIP